MIVCWLKMPFILLELLTALSRVLVLVGTLPRHGNYLLIYNGSR